MDQEPSQKMNMSLLSNRFDDEMTPEEKAIFEKGLQGLVENLNNSSNE